MLSVAGLGFYRVTVNGLSPDAFFYKYLGGITVDRTGPVPVKIAPYCPKELTFVRCNQRLPEGEIFSAWQRENGHITFEIRVPTGLAANVELRAGDETFTAYLPDGGERKVTLRDR